MARFLDKIVGGLGMIARALYTGTAQPQQVDVTGKTVDAPTIKTASGIESAAAALVGTTAFGLLGKAAEAFKDGEAAVAAGGLNLTLDKDELADLVAVVGYLKNHPLSSPQRDPIPAAKSA